MTPHYSRRAEEALARGECVDPESWDIDGDDISLADAMAEAQRDTEHRERNLSTERFVEDMGDAADAILIALGETP